MEERQVLDGTHFRAVQKCRFSDFTVSGNAGVRGHDISVRLRGYVTNSIRGM